MRNRIPSLIVVAFVLLCSAFGQSSPEPQAAIGKLIADFQHAAVIGAPLDQYFSPAVRAHEKREIDLLQSKSFLKFAIGGYGFPKDLRLVDEKHATLAATIMWETRDQEASRSATLRFEEADGAWYFSSVDFWAVSVVWAVPLIILSIAYGCGLTFMFWHSNKQQWSNPRKKDLWQALAVLPFSLFFYWSRRPWTTP